MQEADLAAFICFLFLNWIDPGSAKALELFMANIVEAAVKEARETGGKKLTAYHLFVSNPLSSLSLGVSFI